MINKTTKLVGADEVPIRRGSRNGDVVISTKPVDGTWAEFFALRDNAAVSPDCMNARPLNEPLRARDSLAD